MPTQTSVDHFASVELAWAPDNSLLFTQSDIFISGTIVMQSTLVDAGFPFCVSTEIVVSPYVQSLGVLRGSQSGSANYTAMPLGTYMCNFNLNFAGYYYNNIMACLIVDFTGPVNLRGTPIFTHINGSVTRVMINVTWDAVEAQVYIIITLYVVVAIIKLLTPVDDYSTPVCNHLDIWRNCFR